MSNLNDDQVIVVTEEKKKRRTGALWVGAGAAALLIGGSTFALWNAADTFTGGTVTAGDLNLTNKTDTTFWDVSADRNDATEVVGTTDGSQLGHRITDINTWRIAPGDKLAASFEAEVTLEGDNLVARLGINGLDELAQEITGMNYSYEIYSGENLLVSETLLPVTPDAPLMYLSAPMTGQDAGLDDAKNGTLGSDPAPAAVTGVEAQTAVFGMTNTTADLNIVIYASFFEDKNGDFTYDEGDVTVGDRVDVENADVLADLELSLTQVRDAGAQFELENAEG